MRVVISQPFLNKNLIKKGQTVGVAVSGGKDSIFLLNVLYENKDKLGIKIVALNLDHGIREKTSALDSQFVFNYCMEKNIPLKQIKVESDKYSEQNGLSIEEGARKLRYEFFLKCVSDGFCDIVATAHHLSDFTETVLFNLFRGASPNGLAGIPETAYNGKIIRPILKVAKQDIEEYIKINEIPFVEDETNFLSDYSRNFLRLEVIPIIKSKFPEMEKAIERFAEILSVENAFLEDQAEKVLVKNGDEISLPISVDDAIFSRACIIAMKLMGIRKDYEKAHIDGLVALRTSETGKTVSLLNGVNAVKNYESVVFYKKKERTPLNEPFAVKNYFLGGRILSFENGRICDCKGLYFDGDKIPDNAVVRYRKDGDFFTKFGGGTKSLGDYLTNKKIPQKERDFIPLIAVGSEILVICGVEISDKVKIVSDTERIITVSIK